MVAVMSKECCSDSRRMTHGLQVLVAVILGECCSDCRCMLQ